MYDKKELCDKIKAIYPEIGECGIDIDVTYDTTQKAWVVDLHKAGHHRLKTYLESEDADTCMMGKKCIGLALQVSQLVANIKALDTEEKAS